MWDRTNGFERRYKDRLSIVNPNDCLLTFNFAWCHKLGGSLQSNDSIDQGLTTTEPTGSSLKISDGQYTCKSTQAMPSRDQNNGFEHANLHSCFQLKRLCNFRESEVNFRFSEVERQSFSNFRESTSENARRLVTVLTLN